LPGGEVDQAAQIDREVRYPLDMPLGIGVLCFDCVCEREEHVLETDEAIVQLLCPDEGPYPCNELDPVHRLADEVVGSALDGADLRRHIVEGGYHNHRNHACLLVLLESTTGFETVHDGHHDIEQDQVY